MRRPHLVHVERGRSEDRRADGQSRSHDTSESPLSRITALISSFE